MTETKPCPFCGESVNIDLSTKNIDREGTPIALSCGSCSAVGPWEYEQDNRLFFEHAKILWNQRSKND